MNTQNNDSYDVEQFLRQFDEAGGEQQFAHEEQENVPNQSPPDGKILDEERVPGPTISLLMRCQVRIGGDIFNLIEECRRHLRLTKGQKVTIKRTVEYLVLEGLRKRFPEIYKTADDAIKKSTKL